MSNPTELPDLAHAYLTGNDLYLFLTNAQNGIDSPATMQSANRLLIQLDSVRESLARRAQPEGEAPQAERNRVMRSLIEDAIANHASPEGYIKFAMSYFDKATAPAAQHAESGALASAEAVELLEAVFDAWENGVGCYEDPENNAGYLGMAFRLDDDVFNRCVDLLGRKCPPRNAAQQAAAPGNSPEIPDGSTGASGTPEALAELPRLYRFDCYVGATKMAAGVGVHATSMEEAEEKARWIADKSETIKFESNRPCHATRKCGICAAYERAAKLDGGQEGSESNG